MRKLTLAIAVAAGFAATPVLACPMHQAAAQTTGSTAAASPMMCGTPTAGGPGPATGPDDPACTAGPVHGRHVPVLPEHGHDAAPAATAGRHAGHARDAEHARHAAGRAYESSGTSPVA